MALTATATAARWIGFDLDLTVRIRNSSVRPVTLALEGGLARRDDEPFAATVVDVDRTVDPLDPEDPACPGHWVPWRSSVSHVLRVRGIGFLPDSVLVVVEAGGEREILDVDLSGVFAR